MQQEQQQMVTLFNLVKMEVQESIFRFLGVEQTAIMVEHLRAVRHVF